MTHQQTAQDALIAADGSEVGRGCSDAAGVDLMRLWGMGGRHKKTKMFFVFSVVLFNISLLDDTL